jgi:ATP-binding cassette subfamily C protein CydCD
LSFDDVRGAIGLVDDDPHVFATSVCENVRLARPDADDAAVEGAVRRAGLGPWLDELADGLDAHLGDGGRTLLEGSGDVEGRR